MNVNNFHRLLTAVSVSASVILALAGCGNAGSANNRLDDTGKPIVTIMPVKVAAMIPMKDMAWTKQLEEDCDCVIRWQEVQDTAWSQQKAPALAAGDIADLSIKAVSPEETAKYPDLFEEMTQHLDQLPNVKRFFDEQPDARKLVTVDGKIRVLPSDRGKDFTFSGQTMVINKTWLDKLGLNIPTTWDELYNVLVAFKTKDPNGNGKADEIPMNIQKLETKSIGGWWSPFLLLNSTGIATSFSYTPSQQGIYLKNGKVGSWIQTNEFRQLVDFYHKLVSEGLIPADALTKDSSKYDAQNRGDGKTATVGVAFGWSNRTVFGQDNPTLSGQYVAMPAPASQSDVTAVWDASGVRFEDHKLAMSAKAPNKKTVLKVIDLLYSEKYSVQQLYGSIPEYVTDDGDHTYTISDDTFTETNEGKMNSLQDRLAGWIPDSVTLNNEQWTPELKEINKVYESQLSSFDHDRDAVPMYLRTVDENDSNTLTNNNSEIFDYALPIIARWMIQGGADQEWDEYTANLNKLGMEENVAIWQKAYDEYTK